ISLLQHSLLTCDAVCMYNICKITLLRKVAAQSVIYHIWKQRNNLVHNQKAVPSSIVFQGINREIKNIISSRRHNKFFKPLLGYILN
ncbi:hypothetical protein BRARA_B03217, partial [Brassica rapa]